MAKQLRWPTNARGTDYAITLRKIDRKTYDATIEFWTRDGITDWSHALDDLLWMAVVRWKGIVGRSNRPLQCSLRNVLTLPLDLKLDLVRTAIGPRTWKRTQLTSAPVATSCPP